MGVDIWLAVAEVTDAIGERRAVDFGGDIALQKECDVNVNRVALRPTVAYETRNRRKRRPTAI
jgi:hypothetical protein